MGLGRASLQAAHSILKYTKLGDTVIKEVHSVVFTTQIESLA